MAGADSKKKIDPFKTRKTRSETGKVDDVVEAPDEVKQAIDQFRECQEQAKHYEGEATVYKDQILQFGKEQYSKRALGGMNKSFKIVGDETMVTFVVQDSSAGLTDEEVEEFAEKWGPDAAESLITRDFRSIRFDAKVLEANYDQVVEALQALPEQVLDNLFKPMLMKAKPSAVETAKKFTKSNDELQELLEQLKMKHYVR